MRIKCTTKAASSHDFGDSGAFQHGPVFIDISRITGSRLFTSDDVYIVYPVWKIFTRKVRIGWVYATTQYPVSVCALITDEYSIFEEQVREALQKLADFADNNASVRREHELAKSKSIRNKALQLKKRITS